MIRKPLLLLLLLLTSYLAQASERPQQSFAGRMLEQIREPVLDAFQGLEAGGEEALAAFAPLWGQPGIDAAGQPASPPEPFRFDIPQIRKYQNSHKAPIRFYTGGGAVTLGGVMLIAGYRQDTKYPWSGPYMSPSPLNVFGILIVAVGLGLITSGLIYYSKYKKHVIAPYHKPY